MNDAKNTIGTISKELRAAVKTGKLSRSYITPLYTALEKYYNMTSDDEDWRTIYFDEDDFERRAKTFYERNNGKYSDPNTPFVYKARAKRAIRIFNDLQKSESKISQEHDAADQFIVNIRLFWKEMLKTHLNDDQKSSHTEVIICPTKGDGIAALVVSNNSRFEDYKTEYKMLATLLGKTTQNAKQ